MTRSEIYITKLNQLVVLLSTSAQRNNSQDLMIIRRLVYELKEGLKQLDHISSVTEAPKVIEPEPVPTPNVDDKKTSKARKKKNDSEDLQP